MKNYSFITYLFIAFTFLISACDNVEQEASSLAKGNDGIESRKGSADRPLCGIVDFEKERRVFGQRYKDLLLNFFPQSIRQFENLDEHLARMALKLEDFEYSSYLHYKKYDNCMTRDEFFDLITYYYSTVQDNVIDAPYGSYRGLEDHCAELETPVYGEAKLQLLLLIRYDSFIHANDAHAIGEIYDVNNSYNTYRKIISEVFQYGNEQDALAFCEVSGFKRKHRDYILGMFNNPVSLKELSVETQARLERLHEYEKQSYEYFREFDLASLTASQLIFGDHNQNWWSPHFSYPMHSLSLHYGFLDERMDELGRSNFCGDLTDASRVEFLVYVREMAFLLAFEGRFHFFDQFMSDFIAAFEQIDQMEVTPGEFLICRE